MKKITVLITILACLFISSVCAQERIVAGTIRNKGKGWKVISDSVHVPIGIKSVYATNTYIVVKYDFRADEIHSFIVGVDESYAYYGLVCGASVAVDSVIIKCYLPGNKIINPRIWFNCNGNLWLKGSFTKYE